MGPNAVLKKFVSQNKPCFKGVYRGVYVNGFLEWNKRCIFAYAMKIAGSKDKVTKKTIDNLMRVLVCEDDRLMQKALDILLSKEGFEIFHASDGNEAFELIKDNEYDLLIVDIHMPYSSGLELIEYLRHTLLKETPVIVVTAISNQQIKKQAVSLGIDDYVLKPYDPKELIKKINATLKI